MIPLVAGKPHQVMQIDKATNIILEIKRFIPQENTGSLTRFTKFAPVLHISNDMFISNPISAQQDIEPSLIAVSSDDAYLLPATLYGGFTLQTKNNFEVNGKSVKHLRYTDGLLPVSIFQTARPVKAPAQDSQQIIQWSRPLQMGASQAGNIYQWKKNEAYYILIGDVKPALLEEIAGQLKN